MFILIVLAGVALFLIVQAVPAFTASSADLPDGAIVVRELLAADPPAGAALWHNLLDRDLVGSVTADLRSPDDPVLHQLADGRRARQQVSDGLVIVTRRPARPLLAIKAHQTL